MEYCEYVLEYTPENIKAHYRKGLALYHMKNFEKAIDLFHQAASIAKNTKGKVHLYSKSSKISNTFLFLFSNKMLVFRAGIQQMLVRIAHRKDPDQTASPEAVWSGSAVFV